MDKFKRNERLAVMTKILSDAPNRIFTLSFFCEMFGAAKSTVSEDASILAGIMQDFKLGTLETVTGEDGIIRAQSGDTGIFIMPGYTFHATDALITNFHLPQSTLLMLISALMGREEALRVYREAVKERYRFFSFGDAMLIL